MAKFQPGQPKPPGSGRKRASKNRSTVEVRSLAQNLLSDRKYLDNLRKRLNDGKLPPAVETMLWHYAYGRPAERHSFAGPDEGPTELRINVVDKRKVPSSYEESLAREKDA